jgi:4-diphosphocytidyl-2-C-methyl-D-erythritol kinase
LGLSQQALIDLAARLGSDVAFFLYGGTAVVRGRGEAVVKLPPLPHGWIVLMIPPVTRESGKTGRLYGSLKVSHYTKGEATDSLITLLSSGGDFGSFGLFNVFESVAFASFSGLEGHWRQFQRAGAREVHLAGSGPAMFTMVRQWREAEEIYRQLKRRGLEAYLTETLEDPKCYH